MKVLVACEESQVVTKAFRKLGAWAYSCDVQRCSGGHPEWHRQQDVSCLLHNGWDLIIAFPPCTYLTSAGNRWFNIERYGDEAIERRKKRDAALKFVTNIYNCPCKHVVIENPLGWLNTHFRKPDQIIQPYWFGETESKRTCLWLKNVPRLKKTNIVKPKIYARFKTGPKKGQPIYGVSYMKFAKDRGKIRSVTSKGVAAAMAEQWMTALDTPGNP